MKEFNYVIKDELGIHARPAGLLVKTAQGFSSSIALFVKDKEIDAKKLIRIMGAGIKKDADVLVKIEGEDEEEAFAAIKDFFESNL